VLNVFLHLWLLNGLRACWITRRVRYTVYISRSKCPVWKIITTALWESYERVRQL